MDIDDSSDKVRRNLLLLSFAIVIGNYFDLSFEQQGKIFSVINYTELSPFKFWVVLTFVLTYLFLRYWFDETRQKDFDLVKTELESFRYKLVHSLLKREVENSILKKQHPKWIIEFKELAEDGLKSFYDDRGLPSKVNASITIEQSKYNKWCGELGTAYEMVWKNKGFYTKDGGYRYQYQLKKHLPFVLTSASIIKISTLSKTNVDFFVPVALSVVAFFICLTEIFKSF